MSSYDAGQKAGVVAAVICAVVIFFAVGYLIGGYFLMLAFGVLWSKLGILAPLGYWSSVQVGWAISVLGAALFGTPSFVASRNKN